MLVDTHCHLADASFDEDRTEVLARASAAGVDHVVMIADTLAASRKVIRLAHDLDMSATAGVHPHEASSWNEEVAGQIEAALDDPVVVAVGETGLDYHYDHSPRHVQRRVFEAQLALAAKHGKPVVVHAREADDDMAAMLATCDSGDPVVVLHSFSSGARVFDVGLAVGAYFSFSGMVTFKNWKQADCLSACPPDHLLVETDAPYLAPVPHRGKRNEPAFVLEVARKLAQIRGAAFEELARLTTANAERCFGERIGLEHS